MTAILIRAGDVAVRAELFDTPTAEKVLAALPIYASAKTWGEEIYFSVDVSASEEPAAKDVMELGEIAFWPGGNAIAIGFGRTPASRGDEIRLVSPCNVWARALDDVRAFASVQDGDEVAVLEADS
ncbi:MAG: cyclophilin-like fold protein [Filomicrobium sp.]